MIGLYLKKMKLTSGEIIRVAICLLFTDNIVLISERNMKIMFIGWQIVPYLASHTNAVRACHSFLPHECLLNRPVTSVPWWFRHNLSLCHG